MKVSIIGATGSRGVYGTIVEAWSVIVLSTEGAVTVGVDVA
jgi:hypothetical protein